MGKIWNTRSWQASFGPVLALAQWPIQLFPAAAGALLDTYNTFATDKDGLAFPEVAADNIPALTAAVGAMVAGRGIINYASFQRAQTGLPPIASLVEAVNYDIEDWANTPPLEYANLTLSSRAMAVIAANNGLEYSVATDLETSYRPNTVEKLSGPAEMFSFFAHQLLFLSLEGFIDHAIDCAKRARSANPSIKLDLTVQLIDNDPTRCFYAVRACQQYYSSVTLYIDSTAPTLGRIVEMVQLMRPPVAPPTSIRVPLGELTLQSSLVDLTVVGPGASVTLDTLTLASSIVDLTIVDAPTCTLLDTLTLTSSVVDLVVTTPGNVALDTLLMPAQLQTLSVIVTPPPPTGQLMWVSGSEVADLPTSGAAWNNLVALSNTANIQPDPTDQENPDDVYAYACALRWLREGNAAMREKARAALMYAIAQVDPLSAADQASVGILAVVREVTMLPIIAQIINLAQLSAANNTAFVNWLTAMQTAVFSGAGPALSIRTCSTNRPNNFGGQSFACRAASDIYLNDMADLALLANVFKGFLGDRLAYAGFSYDELTWQADEANPVGINPMGSTKQYADGITRTVDGIIPDDQRRCSGCAGPNPIWPVPREDYVYENLQGIVVAAELLHRQGYPAWDWENQAIKRAFTFLHSPYFPLAGGISDFRALGDSSHAAYADTGNDRNPVWVTNFHYRTTFYTETPVTPSRNMGFTDWTHNR